MTFVTLCILNLTGCHYLIQTETYASYLLFSLLLFITIIILIIIYGKLSYMLLNLLFLF